MLKLPRPLLLLIPALFALLLLSVLPALATSPARPQAPSTVINVTTTDDELNTDGDCSLREAIQAANTDTPIDACPAGSGADTIHLPAGIYTFTLPTVGEDANQDGDLDISQNVDIYGAGAQTTIINGNDIDRIFHITTSGINVVIANLTITNGTAVPGTGNGGGVFSSGYVFLGWVNIADNSAPRGGGIATDATGELYIQNSAIHNNIAPYTGSGTGVAGAIEHFGTSMTIVNSTVSDNISGYFNPTGNLRDSNPVGNTFVRYSTISNNTQGGLFTSGGNYSVMSSIIAGNTGENCNAGTFISGDYNLVSNAECGLGGVNDLTNTDPLLEPLQNAGGETLTRPLLPGSPALDWIPAGINGCGTTYNTDQRDFVRPYNTLCDTGAVESTVPSGNLPPVAVDDSFTINEDWSISFGAPGLLSGDFDPDGDPISVTQVTDPANGTITFYNPDGSFGYTPNPDFNGSDTFSYIITDGFFTDTAVVTMTVNPVNDFPVALNDIYTGSQDIPLNVTAPGPLSNDSDVELDPLTAFLITPPVTGSLLLNPDGSFDFTPPAGYTGTTTFTYTASDSNGYALNFDGVDDYVDVGDTFENFTAVTFEAWVFHTPFTGTIHEIYTKNAINSFSINHGGGDVLHFNLGNGSGWAPAIESLTPIPDNQWTHLAATWDGGTGEVRIYINGQLDNSG